jgi:hypothetical protein
MRVPQPRFLLKPKISSSLSLPHEASSQFPRPIFITAYPRIAPTPGLLVSCRLEYGLKVDCAGGRKFNIPVQCIVGPNGVRPRASAAGPYAVIAGALQARDQIRGHGV